MSKINGKFANSDGLFLSNTQHKREYKAATYAPNNSSDYLAFLESWVPPGDFIVLLGQKDMLEMMD